MVLQDRLHPVEVRTEVDRRDPGLERQRLAVGRLPLPEESVLDALSLTLPTTAAIPASSSAASSWWSTTPSASARTTTPDVKSPSPGSRSQVVIQFPIRARRWASQTPRRNGPRSVRSNPVENIRSTSTYGNSITLWQS
ncbi:hypothetical protein BRC81_08260 [Halobacteriales archaeon QS_1_68_20]|nr:MAG: hypothetical protein BRC81_08260 [Halobacteriales archaeon QS_1_68_20]